MTPDKQYDFNIFKPGQASFGDIIESFKSFHELAAPLVEINSAGIRLFTIPVYKDQNYTLLPAFTDARLPKPPFAIKSPLELLNFYFHSQNADFFTFNPSGGSSGAAGPEVRLNRLQLSLIIGALETLAYPPLEPSAAETGKGYNPSNSVRLATRSLEQIRPHSAYYMASFAGAGPQANFIKAAALAELDLYQDAYDLLKDDRSPRALCLLAEIYRRTDNPRKAREILLSIPQGTGLDRKKSLETAWLDLDEGKTAEAQRIFGTLLDAGDERQEALFGLALAGAGKVMKTEDPDVLREAVAAFEAALESHLKVSSRMFFYAGNFFLRLGRSARAEICYRESSRLFPSPQARANLVLALLKGNELEEAAAIAAELALTEPASVGRLAAQFPKDKVQWLFKNAFRSILEAKPPSPPPAAKGSPVPAVQTPYAPAESVAPPPALAPEARDSSEPQPSEMGTGGTPTQPNSTADKLPAQKPGTPAGGQADGGVKTEEATVSLEAAAPKISSRSVNASASKPVKSAPPAGVPQPQPGRQTGLPGGGKDASADAKRSQANAPDTKLETFKGILSSHSASQEETKKDSFLSRAFTLASDLEDQFGEKIYFNADGLTQIERKLRLTFIKTKDNPQERLNAVKDCSAFLCYVLQERLKGRLIKFQDFDPWGWPMIFEQPSRKITSYPVERVWKLLWQDDLPEPGWLIKYLHYMEEELNSAPGAKLQGVVAVRSRVMSHPEKITEAQTEHKRILILASSLGETSYIETGRTGLIKLEQILKNSFHPNVPPTADGWKLLRCYGHILAGTLTKDFKASWYNVEGNDGLWSMQTPWKTFIFPIGKIYKATSARESLLEYYDHLSEEKLKYMG
ncbi:MAG: hypothetical protein NTX59_12350 [Elusimicrobia bacterium]|nr:hypothetical protein [Elusimicrobiota bacterium]